jgi:hypothetical protein
MGAVMLQEGCSSLAAHMGAVMPALENLRFSTTTAELQGLLSGRTVLLLAQVLGGLIPIRQVSDETRPGIACCLPQSSAVACGCALPRCIAIAGLYRMNTSF